MPRARITHLADLLTPPGQRQPVSGYFVLCAGLDAEETGVLRRYLREAERGGAVIVGRLPNPDGSRLAALQGSLRGGLSAPDIAQTLAVWLPALAEGARARLAEGMAEGLRSQREAGKPETAVRTCAMKWLCWLHDELDRLVRGLGRGGMPKLLYADTGITPHEARLLDILCAVGADILILALGGEAGYDLIPASVCQRFARPGQTPLPADFDLSTLRPQPAPAPAGLKNKPESQTPSQTQKPSKTQQRQGISADDRPKSKTQQQPVQPASGQPAAPSPAPERTPTLRQGNAPAPVLQPARREIDPYAYFPQPDRRPCTNVWMTEASPEALLTPVHRRGVDETFFYNCFLLRHGVPDALSYERDLLRLRQRLAADRRPVLILDDTEPDLTPEELSAIRRRTCHSPAELAVDLAPNLPRLADEGLQRISQHAFVATLMDAAGQESDLRKLTQTAVCMLCRIRRHQAKLFPAGGGQAAVLCLTRGLSPDEALYLRYLSRMPVDVAVLCPDLRREPGLADESLLLLEGAESLHLSRFPADEGTLQVRTAAAQAASELDSLLHTQAGSYRANQFREADAVILQTTWDELIQLWPQELQYRSGFSADEGLVTMPVLFARVSGVEDGKTLAYWQQIRQLILPDSILITRLPLIQPGQTDARIKAATDVLQGLRIDTDRLRLSPAYPFGHLREDMQRHMLRKLQWMLDSRLIAGTGVSGMEHRVVATVLSLEESVLRQIQRFDFTRQNPKALILSTGDGRASAEDAILLSFLSLIGFDVVFFTPTGYQTIEPHLTARFPVEHQIGPYQFDLRVPDFRTLPEPRLGWLRGLLKRDRHI